MSSELVASMARAANAAWLASGGPSIDEATAAMAEAHSLQLCLLGLQHEISQCTGSAGSDNPSSEMVELENDDGLVASQLFEGHQVLDGGGFRRLEHGFATREECAKVHARATHAPRTHHARTTHAPRTHHARTTHAPRTRHARAMRLGVCAQVRAAATLSMVQSFRRGGQTTLSITSELHERMEGCGASVAVPCLGAVMERVQAAAQRAHGGALYPCGALLIRLADPHTASLAAPCSWPLPPCQPYWSAHVDKHNVPFYDVSALCAAPSCSAS